MLSLLVLFQGEVHFSLLNIKTIDPAQQDLQSCTYFITLERRRIAHRMIGTRIIRSGEHWSFELLS